jgi:hypothetical protein
MNDRAAGVSIRPETRALIDFLVEKPLEQRRSRNDRERELWAVRELRTTVRHVVRHMNGPSLTLVDVDEMLQHRELRDLVWESLSTRELRSQIPPYGASSQF